MMDYRDVMTQAMSRRFERPEFPRHRLHREPASKAPSDRAKPDFNHLIVAQVPQ